MSFKISYKLGLCFGAILLVCLSAFWLISKNEVKNTLQQQTDGLAQSLAKQTSDVVRELVLSNDILSLNVVLNQLIEEEGILQVSVLDIDGRIIASASNTLNSTNFINSLYVADIALQDAIAGTVELQIDITALQTNIDQLQSTFWLVLAFAMTLVIISAYLFHRHLSKPLLALTEAMAGPLESLAEPDPKRSDELALIQASYSQLVESYENGDLTKLSQSNLFNHNDLTNQAKKAVKVMASVLVVKVVNINTAIELLHPSTLSELLSEYLHYLKQAGEQYNAQVHRITGESAMLIFYSQSESELADEETNDSHETHSFNAICCAQLFLMLMEKIKFERKARASQALAFKLAIHSGDIFESRNTDQSLVKQDNYLMGKTIETSYFLSKQSQPGELLISESAYSQAGGQQQLVIEEQREVTMPSDNMSFMAYILTTDMADYSELLEEKRQQILP